MALVSSVSFQVEPKQNRPTKLMKIKPIHLAFALLATITANAAEPKPPVDKRPPPEPLRKVLDANRDGELSPDEISNASIALAQLDRNEDGQLTRKELTPKPPKDKGDKDSNGEQGPPPDLKKNPPPSPLIRALDLDKNGIISAEEIDAAPESLLILDKDDDGTISRKELEPKPPKKSDA